MGKGGEAFEKWRKRMENVENVWKMSKTCGDYGEKSGKWEKLENVWKVGQNMKTQVNKKSVEWEKI